MLSWKQVQLLLTPALLTATTLSAMEQPREVRLTLTALQAKSANIFFPRNCHEALLTRTCEECIPHSAIYSYALRPLTITAGGQLRFDTRIFWARRHIRNGTPSTQLAMVPDHPKKLVGIALHTKKCNISYDACGQTTHHEHGTIHLEAGSPLKAVAYATYVMDTLDDIINKRCIQRYVP